MKIRQVGLVGLLALLLCGCGGSYTEWRVREVPTTDAERERLARFVENCAVRPAELAGDDQDIEDVIAAAHAVGVQIICEPTLWELRIRKFPEIDQAEWTGQWKRIPKPD